MSRWLIQKLYAGAGRPPARLSLWDGTAVGVPARDALAHLRIHNRGTLMRLLAHPDLYFGEAYMSGDLEIQGDLVGLLEAVYRARAPSRGKGVRSRFADGLLRRQRNTLDGSRRNIHHHYDLGNDFYQLWLDHEAMQYTCAYFPQADATLEEAQVAKLDHVCRKLQLQPGDTVVEAGCGWGGLARHMARHYGVRVRAFNISREQLQFAREKARAEGLEGRVEYIEDDYRNVSGDCDVFVSVGMLEHVGTEHYPEMAEAIDRVLKPDGRGLIHSIGRNRAVGPMNAWIERRIFPGAYPPSLREMLGIFEHRDFSVLDVENLRLHYAATLRHWLQRYEQNVGRVREMFDDRFVRAWRLYLCGSIAAFNTGQLQLFQVVFNRATCNELPPIREHVYCAGHRG
ncbi:class I SAM-dependent methyltransferase [Thioalkalivibrio sp.]|uniref:class I SAM-dependent methyltransferase n=1 Tax=Thioalkalivibrio sp. TaxID=2093813 RepID=UPI0039754D85